AEYSRSNPAAPRQVTRVDEPARVRSSRSNPRVGEYQVRATPKPAVASSQAKTPSQRQAAPIVAQRNAEDDKTSAAVALARAAAEGTAASAREVASEAAAREAAVTASNTKRRTPLAIFGGVAL